MTGFDIKVYYEQDSLTVLKITGPSSENFRLVYQGELNPSYIDIPSEDFYNLLRHLNGYLAREGLPCPNYPKQ